MRRCRGALEAGFSAALQSFVPGRRAAGQEGALMRSAVGLIVGVALGVLLTYFVVSAFRVKELADSRTAPVAREWAGPLIPGVPGPGDLGRQAGRLVRQFRRGAGRQAAVAPGWGLAHFLAASAGKSACPACVSAPHHCQRVDFRPPGSGRDVEEPTLC